MSTETSILRLCPESRLCRHVAVSRGQKKITVFTADKENLRESIGVSDERTSALELLRKGARTVDRTRKAKRPPRHQSLSGGEGVVVTEPSEPHRHFFDDEVDGCCGLAYCTSMTINLKPEMEQLIQKDIERGPYQSVDEFVERAVQMLHEKEALLANDSAAIHDKIERALGQFERGEGLTPEESRANLQKKKADWLKQQKP